MKNIIKVALIASLVSVSCSSGSLIAAPVVFTQDGDDTAGSIETVVDDFSNTLGDFNPPNPVSLSDAIVLAFDTKSPQTAEDQDHWATFRLIFRPPKTQSGEDYLMGADISTVINQSMVVKSMTYAFNLACLFGLLITAVIVLLLKNLQKKRQTKINVMCIDDLTGLPNRNQLMQDLSVTKNTHLALIDIKKFSDVTNTYGPVVGDSILQQFAFRLKDFGHQTIKTYQAYRVSGDVFATLDNQPLKAGKVHEESNKLVDYLVNHRYKINRTEYFKLAVTVGGVNQNENAFMLASMALEEAKSKNIQSYLYDNKSKFLPATYKQISKIKQQLQLALDEDRLVPFFQPIFTAKDQKLAKYECLARITDSAGNVELTPDLFIPISRRVRMYAEITRRMVIKSIEAAKGEDYIISINLSISDIMNDETSHFLYQSVKESKMAKRIQFEILETEAIDDLVKVKSFITKLQQLGAKVGIDDLGSNYSNFDRLSLLPVDFIKIDGSIITSIENDKDAQAITKSIVLIAHRHNIKVTAENCYNQTTTDMAVLLGVDYLQGFYLGKPDNIVEAVKQPVG